MVMPERRMIGGYEILRKLARGGMGDVYLAHDTQAQRDVALKVIEQSQDSDSHDTIAAERSGAHLQARLAQIDEGVVKIFETGDMDGYFFVAMEYIEGHDLSDLLRRGPAPPRRCGRYRPVHLPHAPQRAFARRGHRWQSFSWHRARRYQTQKHPHRR